MLMAARSVANELSGAYEEGASYSVWRHSFSERVESGWRPAPGPQGCSRSCRNTADASQICTSEVVSSEIRCTSGRLTKTAEALQRDESSEDRQERR